MGKFFRCGMTTIRRIIGGILAAFCNLVVIACFGMGVTPDDFICLGICIMGAVWGIYLLMKPAKTEGEIQEEALRRQARAKREAEEREAELAEKDKEERTPVILHMAGVPGLRKGECCSVFFGEEDGITIERSGASYFLGYDKILNMRVRNNLTLGISNDNDMDKRLEMWNETFTYYLVIDYNYKGLPANIIFQLQNKKVWKQVCNLVRRFSDKCQGKPIKIKL